jgi:hypothetical protein
MTATPTTVKSIEIHRLGRSMLLTVVGVAVMLA